MYVYSSVSLASAAAEPTPCSYKPFASPCRRSRHSMWVSQFLGTYYAPYNVPAMLPLTAPHGSLSPS